jgi:S-adenosylmethionine uptake transporter
MQNKKIKTSFVGIVWFILSLLISNLNDIITKQAAIGLPYFQVAFLRFAFGTLTLLPFMIWQGKKSFFTNNFTIHVLRGGVLFVAITIWTMGLTIIPLVTATLLTFTIPFFVLILAYFCLHEKVNTKLWMATLLGFLGAVILLNPTQPAFNNAAWLMVLAALLFASLDIINKKFINQETMLSMLFYSALVTTLLGAYPAFAAWQPMSTADVVMLLLLGANGNLILFCLLKAFKYVGASTVAPYRYLEILLSAVLGIVLFGEFLQPNILLGAVIIILTTGLLSYEQLTKRQ